MQFQKNHTPILANLRSCNAPSVTRLLPPKRQRIREIRDQRSNRRRRGVIDAFRHFAQSRVTELQNSPNAHGSCLSQLQGLWLPPLPCFRRAKHSLDDSHVGDAVLKWPWNLASVTNRARKSVSLHRILITNGNRLHSNPSTENIPPVINIQPRRPVIGC